MSYIKHFSIPFSKEKSNGIIEKLASHIQERYELPVPDFNPWPNGSGPNLYTVSYRSETEQSALGKRQYNALFEKNCSVSNVSKSDRESAAFDKWMEAERQCLETNRRFRFGASGHSPERETLIFLVSRKIASILGPCPSLDDLSFGFGPGANVGCARLTSTRRKLSAHPTCSTKAVAYLSTLQKSHPFWPLQKCKVEKGRLTFVPKTALIDRSIVIEPIVNTYVQKGIGSYIRSQLRRVGVDLTCQETNRDFARFGSKTGLVATVDLSSASDTISKEVVSELLPYEWVSLLDGFRTPTITYGEKEISLQKWSSMGNGYTFELESLIFFAIASVISSNSRFVNVFGDDIIIPARFADELYDALSFFGFTPNKEKSFVDGPFRESCGKDFLGGVNVRPCYVKDRLSYQELFRLHNYFIRSHEDELARSVLRYIPGQLKQYVGPDGYGDGHLIGDWIRKRKNRQNGWGGFGFKTISSRPLSKRDQLPMDYAAFIYGTTRIGTSNDSLWDADDRWRPSADSVPDIVSDLWSESMFQERGSANWRPVGVYTLAR